MPHVLNPPSGYIVTANNKVVADTYGHLLSVEWAPRFRYERIAELIESERAHDVEGMGRIQLDTTSLLARRLCEVVVPALANEPDGELRQAAGYLERWDFDTTTDSVAATIYHEFLLKFAQATFVDEMGYELAKEYLADYYLWVERFVKLVEEDSHWFDDGRTDTVETRDDLAVRSFKEAVSSLKRKLGNDMTKWQWGRVHIIAFGHPLDRSRVGKMLFNVGPFPFPGDGETVNRATSEFAKPYDVSMAASIRHIMDFAQLDRTLGIHTTGQSGNPASRHYRDFTEKWLNGECIPYMMDREDFIEDIEGHLTLMPGQSVQGTEP
jgi:penicillin amidase